MEEGEFRLTVNGADCSVTCEPDTPLLDVLRHDLGLAGPKFGCGMGLCGACFVLIDGRARASCDLPVSAVAAPVTTVEGLSGGGRLHPVQQAFIDEQAAQCGYCTSGMVMAAADLATNPVLARWLDFSRAGEVTIRTGKVGIRPGHLDRAGADSRGRTPGHAGPGAGWLRSF